MSVSLQQAHDLLFFRETPAKLVTSQKNKKENFFQIFFKENNNHTHEFLKGGHGTLQGAASTEGSQKLQAHGGLFPKP